MVTIPFCGQTYQDKTSSANAQDSINLYPMRTKMAQYSDKKIGQGIPEDIIMYPTPGYRWARSAGTGEIRAMYVINTTLYLICGNQLLSFTPLGTSNDITSGMFNTLGTLNTSTGKCSIVCNTVQLAISDGSYGYTYTLSGGAFATIGSAGSFPASGGVTNFAYYDGYVFAVPNGTKTVIQSNPLDATTFATQAFDTLTSFPDNAVAIFSDELQLYIFSPKVTEVQYDAGTTPYAGQKVSGVLIQAGCVAWPTIQKVANTIIWLASDNAGKAYVASLESYSTKVISTPPINEALERYTTISDAFAYTYREGDNQFYVLTFPSQAVTWVYDIKMDMWHKRSINGGADLPLVSVLWQGVHLVGDASGNIYIMSQNYSYYSTYTNGVVTDTPLTRVRTTSHLSNDGKSFFINELFIDVAAGGGFITDSNLSPQPTGTDPIATLEISRDAANTWVTVGTRSMGALGKYQKRLIWRNLGRFRQTATFRLTITDPVETFIIGAKAQIVSGTK